jgi:hypothetical protein
MQVRVGYRLERQHICEREEDQGKGRGSDVCEAIGNGLGCSTSVPSSATHGPMTVIGASGLHHEYGNFLCPMPLYCC